MLVDLLSLLVNFRLKWLDLEWVWCDFLLKPLAISIGWVIICFKLLKICYLLLQLLLSLLKMFDFLIQGLILILHFISILFDCLVLISKSALFSSLALHHLSQLIFTFSSSATLSIKSGSPTSLLVSSVFLLNDYIYFFKVASLFFSISPIFTIIKFMLSARALLLYSFSSRLFSIIY